MYIHFCLHSPPYGELQFNKTLVVINARARISYSDTSEELEGLSQHDNENVNKRKYNTHDKKRGQRRKCQSPVLPLRFLWLIYSLSGNRRKRLKRADLRASTERKQIMKKRIFVEGED